MDQEGWIVFLNFNQHVLNEYKTVGIDQYFLSGNGLENIEWRTQKPDKIINALDRFVQKKIGL